MIRYGLTMENQKLICEKAKERTDGCFSFRGVAYRVKDGKVTHFGASGKILENFGSFNVVIGSYEDGMGGLERARKLLKMIAT